jgi:hypothetical protein
MRSRGSRMCEAMFVFAILMIAAVAIAAGARRWWIP